MARVILKLSGEALAGEDGKGFSEAMCRKVAGQVREILRDHEVGIVIGGGNFWRGRTGNEITRPKSDQIGMLATVMNCIYVSEIFRNEGMETEIFTPFAVGAFTKLYDRDEVLKSMKGGKAVFFAGGTGHPYFSTDTGVVLRAVETEADVILLAKNVDGIYDSDPALNPSAVRYDTLPIEEVVRQGLKAVDLTASVLAMENRIPMRVFALQEENSIIRAASGEFNGTTITV